MALLPLSKSIVAANVILMVFATAAVSARIYTSRVTKQKLKLDDYFIVLAWILASGTCILGIYGGAANLLASDMFKESLSQLSKTMLVAWLSALLCYICYGLIKVSILLFYRRIFTTRSFKRASGIVLGVVVSEMLAVVLVQIFSAKPVDRWWNYPPGFSPNLDKFITIDYQLFLMVTAILNLFLDLTVLTLPILPIRSLNMTNHKKTTLIAIVFGLGAFCVIASAVRIQYTYQLWVISKQEELPTNTTTIIVWNYVWANIEACSSIVAACLPTLVPLLRGSGKDLHTMSLPRYYGHVKQFFTLSKVSPTRQSGESMESLSRNEKTRITSDEGGRSSTEVLVVQGSQKGTHTDVRAWGDSLSCALEEV